MSERGEAQRPSDYGQELDRLGEIQIEMKALEQRVAALERAADASGQTERFLGSVSQRLSAAWSALLGKKEPKTDIAEVSMGKESVSGVPLNVIFLGLLATFLLVVIFD